MLLENLCNYQNLGNYSGYIQIDEALTKENQILVKDLKSYYYSKHTLDQSFEGSIATLRLLKFITISHSRIRQINPLPVIDEFKSLLLRTLKMDSSLSKLIIENVIRYDYLRDEYYFDNKQMPLQYSQLRNLLLKLGLLKRSSLQHQFNLGQSFYEIIEDDNFKASHLEAKRRITIEQLMKQLEKKQEIGDLAERVVLKYEKSRITNPKLIKKIKRISLIDVSAGYDIASFDKNSSQDHDRFIEVKACNAKLGFFWTKNEIDKANYLKDMYFIYLIDVNKAINTSYEPMIIKNPVSSILDTDKWQVTANDYYVELLRI